MHLKREGTWKIHADKYYIRAYKVCGIMKFLKFFEFIIVVKTNCACFPIPQSPT